MWDKIVKKVVNAEIKDGLQPFFGTKKIDTRYPKRYRPSTKKNKDDTFWEYYNKAFNQDKNKTKSYNLFSVNQS